MALITRRRLLVGGAVVGVGALAGLAVVEFGPAAPGARVLSVRELAVLAGVARVMFPAGPFPIDGVQAGVPAEVDRIVAEVLQPIHGRAFRALLHTLDLGTLASRGVRFAAAPPEIQADVLATWTDPAVFTRRIATDSFKVVLGMAYFGHPEVLRAMGWRTGCDDRWTG